MRQCRIGEGEAGPGATERRFLEDRGADLQARSAAAGLTVGNLVDANTTVLTTIVSVDPIDVYFDVDERTFLRSCSRFEKANSREGRTTVIPVYLGLTTDKGYPLKGKIDFLENRVNPETGTIRTRGTFHQSEAAGRTARDWKRACSRGFAFRSASPSRHCSLRTGRSARTRGRSSCTSSTARTRSCFAPSSSAPCMTGCGSITEGLAPATRSSSTGCNGCARSSVVAPSRETCAADRREWQRGRASAKNAGS